MSLRQKALSGLYWGGTGYLSYCRWALFTRFGRRLPSYRSIDSAQEATAALAYSREAFGRYRANGRAMQLLFLLRGAVRELSASDQLLIVGPRFENEVFIARALGWQSKSIHALDLLTYSPLISQGDMHSMPYPDKWFNAVSFGWTLSYSKDPRRAADEISRVLRPGGYVALGVEFSLGSVSSRDFSDLLTASERIQEREQVAHLFHDLEVVACLGASQLGRDAIWLLWKPTDAVSQGGT